MCARLAVEIRGSGEPLVLLHGLATDRHIWDDVLPALAAGHRVAAVDLPGFGGSEPAGPGYDLDAVAERIARGLAARGVRGPFDLVGHSLGGGIALALASARPRAVRRLILVAPAGLRPLPPAVAAALAAGADAALRLRRSAVPLVDLRLGRRLLLGFTAADGGRVAPAVARRMVEASAGSRRTGAALGTITTADLRPLLGRLDAPLGLIWGERDRTVPSGGARTVLAARADTQVVMLRDTGHVPMVERPAAFVDALAWLLDRLPDGRKSITTPFAGATTVI